jgi:hypothetical protein
VGQIGSASSRGFDSRIDERCRGLEPSKSWCQPTEPRAVATAQKKKLLDARRSSEWSYQSSNSDCERCRSAVFGGAGPFEIGRLIRQRHIARVGRWPAAGDSDFSTHRYSRPRRRLARVNTVASDDKRGPHPRRRICGRRVRFFLIHRHHEFVSCQLRIRRRLV